MQRSPFHDTVPAPVPAPQAAHDPGADRLLAYLEGSARPRPLAPMPMPATGDGQPPRLPPDVEPDDADNYGWREHERFAVGVLLAICATTVLGVLVALAWPIAQGVAR